MIVVTPPFDEDEAVIGHLPKISNSVDDFDPDWKAEIIPLLIFKLKTPSAASAQISDESSSPERVN